MKNAPIAAILALFAVFMAFAVHGAEVGSQGYTRMVCYWAGVEGVEYSAKQSEDAVEKMFNELTVNPDGPCFIAGGHGFPVELTELVSTFVDYGGTTVQIIAVKMLVPGWQFTQPIYSWYAID